MWRQSHYGMKTEQLDARKTSLRQTKVRRKLPPHTVQKKLQFPWLCGRYWTPVAYNISGARVEVWNENPQKSGKSFIKSGKRKDSQIQNKVGTTADPAAIVLSFCMRMMTTNRKPCSPWLLASVPTTQERDCDPFPPFYPVLYPKTKTNKQAK